MNKSTQATIGSRAHQALATCCIAVFGVFAGATMIQAATVSWDTPANITNEYDVNKDGTLVAAWSLRQNGNGPNGSGISAPFTVNGVAFTNVTNAAGSGNIAISASAGSILPYGLNNAEQTSASVAGTPYTSLINVYKALNFQSFLLQQGGAGKNITLTISGLTANKTYLVQLWSSWPKSTGLLGGTKFTVNGTISPSVDANTTDVYGGVGQYITGTITTGAGETSVSIVASSGDPTNANAYIGVNAVQVREVNKFAWMKNAKYGVGISWGVGIGGIPTGYTGNPGTDWAVMDVFARLQSGNGSQWSDLVDGFDVPSFVNQIVDTGAGYVLFPVGTDNNFYASWNSVYETGADTSWGTLNRGEYTPKTRDLIADLGAALNAKGIKLIVYIASEGPYEAYKITRSPGVYIYPSLRMHSRDGIPSASPAPIPPAGGLAYSYSDASRTHFHAMLTEWSNRWGSKVSGWWFDGVFDMPNPAPGSGSGYRLAKWSSNGDPAGNAAALISAVKAGNPSSLVALNPGVNEFGPLSASQDYTAGESGRFRDAKGKFYEYPDSQFVTYGSNTQIQTHVYGSLGTWWGSQDRMYVDEEIIDYVSSVNKKGGVVTLSVGCSPTGVIGAVPMAQLTSLKAALKPAMAPAVTPEVPAKFTNLALYKPAYLATWQGNVGSARLDPGTGQQQQAHMGVDGDVTTWTAPGGPLAWSYIVDLGSDVSFDRVAVNFNATYYSTRYRIQYSTEAAPNTWTLIDASPYFDNLTGGGLKVHAAGSLKTGRYIRITSDNPNGAGQTGTRMGIVDLGVFNVSGTLPTTKETVWVDEDFPMGSTETTAGAADWKKANTVNSVNTFPPISSTDYWVNVEAGTPFPLNGTKLRWNRVNAGHNEHGFTGSQEPFRVASGDTVYCDVYLDPANVTSEILLTFKDASGVAGTARWGANSIPGGGNYVAGVPGTTGQWMRLYVSAATAGIGGKTLTGMSFATYGGRTFFDRVGKLTP